MTNKQPQVIEYTDQYTPFTRGELVEKMKESMSTDRFEHVLRVEKTALALAEKYEADSEKVSLAAILHDMAKELPASEMRDVIISENLDLELLQFGSAIWHGPVAAVLARRRFELEDEEILEAIATHTIGAPEMSLPAQIVYVADYIEPARDFDGVEKARVLADASLAEAVAYEVQATIKQLVHRKKKIYPKAIDTYNAWIIE